MAEIILVYPKSSYIETAMKGQYLPLALLQAAIFAEKEFSVKIIDQRTAKRWDTDIIKSLNKDTLCVGITALTGEMINNALEVSRFVKKFSKVPVVWGGVHPTMLPAQTLGNKFIDIVVIGEGELTFYELAKALRNNLPLDEIPGLAYKKDGNIKINQYRPLMNLDDLPDPPYHLVNIEDYIIKFGKKNMFIVETSRGCPYSCAFCYSTSFGFREKWRPLSPDKALERIKVIKEKFNIDGIEIIDLNFFIDSKRAKTILSRIIEEKMNIFLNMVGRIDDILKLDNGNLDLLERSNVRRLAVGVESGSQRILGMIQKGISIEQVLDFKDRIDKTRIPPIYNFIGGFPTETEGDLKLSTEIMLRLLKNNKRAKVSIFHCFRPLPGTKLIDVCVEKGLVMPQTLEEWGKYSMTYVEHPWLTKKLKRKIEMLHFVSLFLDRKHEEVSSIAVKIFASFYWPIAYLRLRTLSTFCFVEYFILKLYERMRRFKIF
jgi:radical SAM superfamily enzyme YgiQ (UPF0313 family)